MRDALVNKYWNNDFFDKLTLLFKCIYIVDTFWNFSIITAGNPILPAITVFFGMIILIYRAFHFQEYKDNFLIKILFCFVISFIVSTIANLYHEAIIDSIKTLIWMNIQFFILLIYRDNYEKNKIYKELDTIFKVILVCVLFINILNIGTLFLNISITSYSAPNGNCYPLGLVRQRLYGVVSDPNYLGSLSGLCILLCLHYLRKSAQNRSWHNLVFFCIAILLQFLIISFTGSRTGELASAIVLSLYISRLIIIKDRPNKTVKIIAITALMFLTFFVATKQVVKVYSNVTNIAVSREETKNEEDISNGRFKIWESGIEIFESSPVIGVGFDNILPYCLDNLPDTYIVKNYPEYYFKVLHNVLLDILVSQGVVGISIMMWLLYLIIKILFLQRGTVWLSDVIFTSICCCIFMVILASLNTAILYCNAPPSSIFMSCLGGAIIVCKKKEEPDSIEEYIN